MLGFDVSHRPTCLRLTTIMEVKESKRVVIAKPVASRPSFTSIRTFANLLTDSVTVPPHETVDAAIRPKTLRFKQPAAASVSCPQVIHLTSCLFLAIVIFFSESFHMALSYT